MNDHVVLLREPTGRLWTVLAMPCRVVEVLVPGGVQRYDVCETVQVRDGRRVLFADRLYGPERAVFS